MSRFDKFMIAANWVALVLLGLLGVMAFTVDAVQKSLQGTFEGNFARFLLMLCSLFVLFIEVLWVWGRISKRNVIFTNERGQIKVSVRSLEKTLARAVSAMKEVEAADVRIKVRAAGKSPIRITSYVKITECPDLISVQSRIQQLLENRFNEMLTTAQEKRFNVVITGLKVPSREEVESGRSLPEDFSGPQFPVGKS